MVIVKNKKSRVAVITLSWNGAVHLKACLDELSKQTFKGFSIYVVDNGSTDDTFDICNIHINNLDLHYTRLRTNLGYAKGNNIGISKALKDDPEYIILLNNDTLPHKNWLEELVEYMDNNNDISLAQGLNFINNKKIDSNGIYLEEGFIPRQRSSGQEIFDWVTPTIGPNAAGAIIRSEIIPDLKYKNQLLDDSFFAYVEDVDLMLRAFSRGYKHGYAKDAMLIHLGSKTGERVIGKKMYWGARNTVRMIYKNITPNVWKIKKRKIIKSQLANLEYLIKTNKILFLYYLFGLAHGIFTLPMYHNKRKHNLNRTTISDNQFLNCLVNSNPPLTNPFKKIRVKL